MRSACPSLHHICCPALPTAARAHSLEVQHAPLSCVYRWLQLLVRCGLKQGTLRLWAQHGVAQPKKQENRQELHVQLVDTSG